MSTQKVKKTKKSSRGGKSSSTYLSAEGLHNLKYYRYSGTDKSLLANLFLKRHWDWCTVTFFPIWMAYASSSSSSFFLLLLSQFLVVCVCVYVSYAQAQPGTCGDTGSVCGVACVRLNTARTRTRTRTHDVRRLRCAG
jgi:hypothetical protein